MSKSDWAEVTRPPQDVWKSTTMDSGEQSVMICSPTLMPVLSVTVLDSGLYCSAWSFLPYYIPVTLYDASLYPVLGSLVADIDANDAESAVLAYFTTAVKLATLQHNLSWPAHVQFTTSCCCQRGNQQSRAKRFLHSSGVIPPTCARHLQLYLPITLP